MVQQITVNALIVGCGAAILGFALGLVRSAAGFFDFGLAGIYTVAAYATYALLSAGIASPIAITTAVFIGVFSSLCVHLAIYQPLRRLGATPEVLLITSLAVLILLQNALPIAFGDAILAIPETIFRKDVIRLSSGNLTTVEATIIIVAFVAAAALLLLLRYSDFGLQLRAIRQDVELSRTYGVRPQTLLVGTIVLAAVLASGVGILNAFDTDLVPTMGFRAVLLAAVATIVGGPGSIGGIFVGALLLSAAQQIVALSLPVQWQETIVFSFLIVFVILRPNGIFGRSPER